jgi:hypothetical protein
MSSFDRAAKTMIRHRYGLTVAYIAVIVTILLAMKLLGL